MKSITKKNAYLICDLQFGSTGKGALAGYLAKYILNPDVIVTAWAPNAGHTFVDSDGNKFVSRMIANGVITGNVKYLLIGPGSVINLDVMADEIDMYAEYMKDTIILIHPNAPVVLQDHLDQEEKNMVAIGSTRKGSGAALIQKILRNPHDQNVISWARNQNEFVSTHRIWENNNVVIADIDSYNSAVDDANVLLIEGAQGFSLGMNNGFYPYVTSRECTPHQIMNDCAVPLSRLEATFGAMRTFPIRVANRYDDEGEMIGWSGPVYNDQDEIQFEDIGVEPETTTVTGLRRRIFTFSYKQLAHALRMCEPDYMYLNFCNYMEQDKLLEMTGKIHGISANFKGAPIKYMGWGPNETEIMVQHTSYKGEGMTEEDRAVSQNATELSHNRKPMI